MNDNAGEQMKDLGPPQQEMLHTGSAGHSHIASEQLLQALIENSFDMLALIDKSGKYLYVSESVYQALNYKSDMLVGTNCFDYMHPDDLPWLTNQFELLFNGERKLQVPPYRFKNSIGEWCWIEAIVTNQLDNRNIQAIVVSARDITRQVEAEMKVKEMQMLEALMEGEEKERSRIARDLHDGVSGMIAAAKMQFSALAEKHNDLLGQKEFEQGMSLLESASRLIRTTSHNLMPEILLENGLSEALNRYCGSIIHQHFHIDYYCMGAIKRFSPGFELALYRIAQELIGNIIKHAEASHAIVQLSFQQGILSLTIEDQGKGFDPDPSVKGTGLNSIRKRVMAMNGKIEIGSEPGKGTSIYLEFEK